MGLDINIYNKDNNNNFKHLGNIGHYCYSTFGEILCLLFGSIPESSNPEYDMDFLTYGELHCNEDLYYRIEAVMDDIYAIIIREEEPTSVKLNGINIYTKYSNGHLYKYYNILDLMSDAFLDNNVLTENKNTYIAWA